MLKLEASYKTVRGLTRGLQLLNILNRVDGGVKIADLAAVSGIHRTTVRRLLETLITEGYVRHSDSEDSYMLAMKVRELSEGFRDEQWVSQLAAPLLGELLQEVVWPTDICTLDVDAMVVRETTHRLSRLSFHRSMVGRRLPIMNTAIGKAYLSYCPAAERKELLALLASRNDYQGKLARNKEYVKNLIHRTKTNGFGENYSEWKEEEKIASIALPIRKDGKVIACLNLIYRAQAMTIEDAAKRHLSAMQHVVDKIETGLCRLSIT